MSILKTNHLIDKDLTQQVSTVRSRISQFFSNPSSPSSESTSKLPQFSRYSPTSRCRKVLEKFPKPKEYLSLPHISVHRNPMSIISERDVGRQKLNRKKNLTKGVLGYNLTVTNTDDDKDWEKVIKTCTELIHNKCMLSD